MITLRRIDAHVFRWPVAVPVRTSFGVMHDRPALFVRVEDDQGASGWGEVWCNFPGCGAEHRQRLIDTVMAPLLLGRPFDGPLQVFAELSARTAVLALQSGEPGPMAQAIAGIDLALWDLSARRAGQPLWRHLGGTRNHVPMYASGINPDAPEQTALALQARGWRAFKLKIGFGIERDLANLDAMRRVLGADAALMVDANQGWSLAQARVVAPQLARYGLGWLEEPLRADRPWHEWRTLAGVAPIPLAAGENIAGEAAFDAALDAGVLAVLQPDAAKWGGISGCWPVIRRAQALGVRYCPHYLGGGIGLLASAHLLAAAGGDGLLEVDANPNPLRTALAPMLQQPDADGGVTLGEAPGIGIEPEWAQIEALLAHSP